MPVVALQRDLEIVERGHVLSQLYSPQYDATIANIFTEFMRCAPEFEVYDPIMARKLDQFDYRILEELQRDSAQPQRALADRVGLSQNACWRRLKALESSGAIRGRTVILDRERLGGGFVVFSLIKTRHHSAEWLHRFRKHVSAIPEVIDFFRIGGEYDYLLKIVARDMAGYDDVYKRLIETIELETVTSYFAMEAIEEQRPIPLR
jgi:Lrp/AsnC family transcriptional regulator